MTPQDFLYALLATLADIRTTLNYLIAAVLVTPVAIVAHAFLTRKRKK